jgi:hypothetical protein
LFAYKIAYIFTGFIPARYLVINNDGKTMWDIIKEIEGTSK